MKKRNYSIVVFIVLIVLGVGILFRDTIMSFFVSNSEVDTVEMDMSWLSTYSSEEALEITEEEFEDNKNEWGDEKTNFVSAVYDLTCLISYNNSNFSQDLDEKAQNIFLEYGFDPLDTNEFDHLVEKYKDDVDLHFSVSSALEACKCRSGEIYNDLLEKCVDNLEEDKIVR